jgi:hypothetical protein
MTRRSGGRRHDERSGVEDTTQGDWAADGTAEGGGRTTHARWWLTASGGGGKAIFRYNFVAGGQIVPKKCLCDRIEKDGWDGRKGQKFVRGSVYL